MRIGCFLQGEQGFKPLPLQSWNPKSNNFVPVAEKQEVKLTINRKEHSLQAQKGQKMITPPHKSKKNKLDSIVLQFQ